MLYLMAGLFMFIGIGIKYFKWDFLISGYNTMGKEAKKNVDKEGLCKSMGNFMLIMAGLIFISGITHEKGYKFISTISIMMIFPLTIIQVILGQKYNHNKDIKSKKIEMKFIIVAMVFIIILVAPLLIYGSRETNIQVMPDRIVIEGLYGTAIKRENIELISLEETIPKILAKTDGFDLGYILRGNFNIESIGSSSIYIHENRSPYIVIKTDRRYYIINYKDSKKTEELYKKIIND